MKSVPQAGVYAIEGPDGGIYIGGTENLQKRWVFHRSLLRRGVHHARRLQEVYDQHGAKAITFRVLEYTTADRVGALEQRYLDNLFASRPRDLIYNVTQSVDGATGRIATEEARRRMSAFQKGRKRSDDVRRRMSEGRKGMKFAAGHAQNIALGKSGGKVFTVVAPDGIEYHDVVNITAFAREHGISRSGMSNIACGRARTHKGWFLWDQSTDRPVNFSERRRDAWNNEERDRLAFRRSGGKRYTITAPDGTQYCDVVNVAGFARERGLRPAGLAKVACGETKAYKGWTLQLQMK